MPPIAHNAKIHVTGASGTGVSTLGRELGAALGVPVLDTDDFYWQPTDPRFTEKRPIGERVRLIRAAQGNGGWVLAGSLCGWGDPTLTEVDLIVFLTLPVDERISRLRGRECRDFGARIEPGGDMEVIHAAFLDWAAQYDDPHFTGRSRTLHEVWLLEQGAPVLRLDGPAPLDAMVQKVLAALR